ncbi:MAG: 3,4-dihydroxy-2-butanone-4-phosphate synthase, partial [Proteobacteria bacterium]|nr:3,4-dihydroxy-2-butanone-4-phosphate synthase [Pseudomonadota bacterium]
FLSSPEELIDEARNGRMVILVDDEDRENEGDLVIPAQMATPDAVNFMARFGRGLICLALTSERGRQLQLEPMARINGTPLGTAFTVSIEAKEGISTGISAADRARTVAVAIDAANGPDAITSPGHVFPLLARDGGVLVRAGQTEGIVDLGRLAGQHHGGRIALGDDGRTVDAVGLIRPGVDGMELSQASVRHHLFNAVMIRNGAYDTSRKTPDAECFARALTELNQLLEISYD